MAILSLYLPMITLNVNVNEFNMPNPKDTEWLDGLKRIQINAAYKRHIWASRTHIESEGMEKYDPCK